MASTHFKTACAIALLSLPLAISEGAARGREPCSGKKGGISHCLGSYFICKDGSTSQSKRICTASSGVAPDEEPQHGSGGTRKVHR